MGWRGWVTGLAALGVCACSDGSGGIGGTSAAGSSGATSTNGGESSGALSTSGGESSSVTVSGAENGGLSSDNSAGSLAGGNGDERLPEGGAPASTAQAGASGSTAFAEAAGAGGEAGAALANAAGGPAGGSDGSGNATNGTTAGQGGEAGQAAASSEWRWAQRAGHIYGGSVTVTAIAALPDGTSYVGGFFEGTLVLSNGSLVSRGYTDGFVLQLDVAGALVWAKQLGGWDDDSVTQLTALSGGGVAVAGSTDSGPNFDDATSEGHGNADVFVLELDDAGQQSWLVRNDTMFPETPTAMAVAADGSVYVAGNYLETTQIGAFHLDDNTTLDPAALPTFLAKYSSDGQVAWLVDATHATGDSAVLGLAAASDGSVYAAGRFDGSASWGQTALVANGTDAMLAKFGADGTPRWARQEGGSGYDSASHVALASSGAVYLDGLVDPGKGMLVQYSSAGVRVHDYSGIFTDDQVPLALAPHADGSLFVAGHFIGAVGEFGGLTIDDRNVPDAFAPDSFLLSIDAGGTPVAVSHLPVQAGAELSSMVLLDDGTSYTTGLNQHCGQPVDIGSSVDPVYLSKGDATGACAWDVKPAQSWLSRITFTDQATTPDGAASFVLGHFSGVFDFGNTRLTAKNNDSALAKLNSRGRTVWAQQLGQFGINGQVVTTGSDGSVFVGGSYSAGTPLVDQPVVTKFSADGQRLWAVNGSGYDRISVTALSGLPDNSLLVLGTLVQSWTLGGVPISAKGGDPGMFLAKLAANGDVVWVHGAVPNAPASLAALPDGSSYVVGALRGLSVLDDLPVGNSTGNEVGFLAKYDAAGKAVWVAQQEGQSSFSRVSPTSVAVLPDGKAAITGWFSSGVDFGGKTLTADADEWFVAQYAGTGTTCQWAVQGGELNTRGVQVAALPDGSMYATGTRTKNAYVGGTLFGLGFSAPQSLANQFFLTRLSSAGSALGLRDLTTSQASFGKLSVLADQSLVIGGNFVESAVFGGTTLQNYGEQEMFVAKYAPLP